MRVELLRLRRKGPLFAPLEGDLKELLVYLFDIGFLALRRITWNSPASLLEKLASYEAVHAIESWHDLKKRAGKRPAPPRFLPSPYAGRAVDLC